MSKRDFDKGNTLIRKELEIKLDMVDKQTRKKNRNSYSQTSITLTDKKTNKKKKKVSDIARLHNN